jgi:hypothetical protein
MPVTTDPRWSCFRKKAYPTEAIAKKVANKIKHEHDAEVRAYQCDHCGLFHIGAGKWAVA